MKKIQKLQLGDLQLSKKEMKEVKGGRYCSCNITYIPGGSIYLPGTSCEAAIQIMSQPYYCGSDLDVICPGC